MEINEAADETKTDDTCVNCALKPYVFNLMNGVTVGGGGGSLRKVLSNLLPDCRMPPKYLFIYLL